MEVIQKRSNLIMGLMGENICFDQINYQNYKLVRLELLVKEVKNSDGCAQMNLVNFKEDKNKNYIIRTQ